MQTLHVPLADRSYPIYIGENLLARLRDLIPRLNGNQVMIVTNETVAQLYLKVAKSAFSDLQCDCVILPDGEDYKNLSTLNLIFDALLQHRHSRTTTLVALGGGVVGDMCGFAAAAYQRGVDFVQVPTTLLSQVDSSVGGKTGVNHPLGKNMIGAFHQPICVIADTSTLDTLPDRELSAGVAEVIKYGLINDPDFFDWLEKNLTHVLQRDSEALAHIIFRSCANKAAIVGADERESGQRALLNLGHTFGHAIESGVGYGEWLHGEAVATGMLMAADLSCRMGWLNASDVNRLETMLKLANLPVTPPPSMTPARFLDLMAVDKKTVNKKLRLVLLKSIGDAVITDQFDHQALNDTLAGKPL